MLATDQAVMYLLQLAGGAPANPTLLASLTAALQREIDIETPGPAPGDGNANDGAAG